MGRLNTIILGVSQRVRKDPRLASVLLSIASGGFTAKEVDDATKLITRVFFLSGSAGYEFQSSIVNRSMTRNGLLEIARMAKAKGSVVTDSVVSRLETDPTFLTAIRNTYLAESSVYEGTSLGQLTSAEENNLGYKRWVHTGVGLKARPWHEAMNGTTVGREEYFQLSTGASVLAPHDWDCANPAKEWINCGCVAIYGNTK